MMSRKIFFSIVLLFLILFVLFMFSALSMNILSTPETNDRGDDIAMIGSSDALPGTAFDMGSSQEIRTETTGNDGTEQREQTVSLAGNPRAVLITTADDDLAVFREWCVYSKYRFSAYSRWPDAAALQGASVVLVGRMEYDAAALSALQAYAQMGVPLLFIRLPEYNTLAASPELMDFFGIAQCVEPACRVDGLKLFADFFISKERIYTAGDFYGEKDDTQFTVAYYTLRTGYEGYLVGLLNDQIERGIMNEQLPTLLWRTYTGQSQVYVVNTDLFYGEQMLGVLTAFMSKTGEWYLYPVVNARAIVMTDYPFLSNENAETMQNRYSRDMLGFERDIVWPNVVKVFNNYQAVPNFFVYPDMNYTADNGYGTDDLIQYWKQIKGQSGTIGLSLMQASGLTLSEAVQKSAAYFGEALPDFRFYAAFSGGFTDEQWQEYLQVKPDELLSELTLLLFPYREGRALFTFAGGDVLSALMTSDGFTHETRDDLQLISLMTALGYSVQQVNMDRALFPAGDGDDWSNLSLLWSEGDTYFRDYAKFDNTSVYGLETRVRKLLGTNYICTRHGDELRVALDPFRGQMWFVLRLQGEKVTAVSGGEATMLTDTAYLIRADQATATITLARTHTLNPPN